MTSIQALARLIAARVLRANPIVPAVVVADLGLENGTATVLVQTGDALRRAVYLSPLAIQVGRAVFVTRAGPGVAAPLVVVATNYQVGPVDLGDTTWGDSPPGVTWGSGTGTWGEGAGQGTMPTTTTHYHWDIPATGDGQAAAEALISAVFAEIDQTLYELSLGGGGGGATVGFGDLADRPAAGTAGALYVALDTGQVFVDDGATWEEVLATPNLAGTLSAVNGFLVAGQNIAFDVDEGAETFQIDSFLPVGLAFTPATRVDARVLEFDAAYPRSDSGTGIVRIGEPVPTTRWEPLTNEDPDDPQLVFVDGDVVMVQVGV